MQYQPLEFALLIRCWQEMSRRFDQAPPKAAFSPGKLARLLPYLYIVEREPLGGLAVRLIGSELQENLGGRPSDQRVFDVMLKPDWRLYENFISTCGQQICAGRLLRSVRLHDGLYKTIEALQVPLADKEGAARFILGVMTVRPFQDSSFSEEMMSPEAAILKARYADLGCGLPFHVGALAPARYPVKRPYPFVSVEEPMGGEPIINTVGGPVGDPDFSAALSVGFTKIVRH